MSGAGEESRTVVPPLYFLVALLVMGFFHAVVPGAYIIQAPYRYGGVVLMALSIGLILWAAALFRRAGTNIRPYLPSTALVVSGPYRYTRNPMYLGMAGILLGVAVFLGSITPFVVIFAFMGLIKERFILPEEAKLEAAFGDDYVQYKDRVRRWL
ncbi:MAG TPA: isoprenylcysteine carboxylmethyltransferase family protein [Burkholderiales bacterium]|nr:isoprenylcysteine carboxylmethyltransferase family protein [Burkholderiales bacterium]